MIHEDNTRDREAHAIIGGNQQGKSSLINELITKGYDKRCEKIIVLNSTNPKPFQSYFFCSSPLQLKKKWNGIVRYHNSTGYKETLDDIYQLCADGYLRKGAVVFDDCTKYIGFNPPQKIKDFLVDRAMYDLDLYFTTHALAFFPAWCRRMVNTVTVFKTAETFETSRELKELGYPNYERIFAAWQQTMQTKSTKNFIQPHITIATGV
ncbi:MAG: hypothetical protein KIS94_05625 [Chitinophagales bacterium]|nr:hypothetical protein [Chitinophagales bacterium]